MKTLFLVLAATIGLACAKQYCQTIGDCEHLGGLDCIYSMCDDWGVCGCQRGMTPLFQGSERLFRCVPIKKIGESCSTWDDTGFCGAVGSLCHDGWCRCDGDLTDRATTEARWGGEACLDINTGFTFGEACTDDSQCTGGNCVNAVGTGGLNNILVDRYGTGANDGHFSSLPDSPMDFNVRVCGCAEGEKLTLPNEYNTANFMGRKQPTCEPIRLGDKCFRDSDCGSINIMTIVAATASVQEQNGGWASSYTDGANTRSAATCENNVCACTRSGDVADITGMYCAPPLSGGAACAYGGSVSSSSTDIVGVCNGEDGFICGDPCKVDKYDQKASGRNYTCTCAPGWNGRGTTSCSRVAEGSSCMGDFQCSSLAPNAVCSAGSCTNGAPMVTVSFLTLCLPLLAFFLNRN